jgi:hypothetical protein
MTKKNEFTKMQEKHTPNNVTADKMAVSDVPNIVEVICNSIVKEPLYYLDGNDWSEIMTARRVIEYGQNIWEANQFSKKSKRNDKKSKLTINGIPSPTVSATTFGVIVLIDTLFDL